MYEHLDEWRTFPAHTDRQRLAVEYAEQFAVDHRAIDDELFGRLRDHFADDEILDLTLCLAVYLGLGRTLEVLQITEHTDLEVSAPEQSEAAPLRDATAPGAIVD